MSLPAYIRHLQAVPVDQRAAVIAAAERYARLQARAEHPIGDFDKGQRFHLRQRYACCAGIRSRSRHYPNSEMIHGRTVEHVAHEAGLADLMPVIKSVGMAIKKDAAAVDLIARYFAEQARDALQDMLAQVRTGETAQAGVGSKARKTGKPGVRRNLAVVASSASAAG